VTDDAICEVMQRVANSTVALYIVVDLQIKEEGEEVEVEVEERGDAWHGGH
jgi:hypothetical protein